MTERRAGTGSCWPSRAQELLLKAALLNAPEARAHWEAWAASTVLDDIDAGSYRLLPLVQRNLEELGLEHPYLGRMLGVRRHTLAKNRLLIRELAKVLEGFKEAGIEAMPIRGAALLATCYPEYGLRPMSDVDILIREARWVPAAAFLQSADWRAEPALPFHPSPGFLRVRSFAGFRSPAGTLLNLHWHPLRCCCSAVADNEFWENARAHRLDGVETSVLDPAAQLMHTCLAGLEWSYVPSFRWVADAAMLLRRADDLDSGRICSFASRFGFALRMRLAIEYLIHLLDIQQLKPLLKNLSALPVSRAEHLEQESAARPSRHRPPHCFLVQMYRHHKRSGRGTFQGYVCNWLRWVAWPSRCR